MALDAYLSQHGVARSKVTMGMPLYGRAFVGTLGPGREFTNGVGDGSWERGVWDYKDLPRPGADECFDEVVVASYCFDGDAAAGRAGTLVSYDSLVVARRKARFVVDQRLGGAMWWETSGDRTLGNGSLIEAVVDEMAACGGRLDSRRNWLAFPGSRFANLRDGFPCD